MNTQEGQAKFQGADQLFRLGRYQEALQLLVELNRDFPNTKNILFPTALCYEKLGRTAEAMQLADQLVQQFRDTRAETLKARLTTKGRIPIGGLDLDAIDAQLNAAPSYARKPLPTVQPVSDTSKYLAIAAGAFLGALAFSSALTLWGPFSSITGESASGARLLRYAVIAFVVLGGNILFTYIALRMMKVVEEFVSELPGITLVCAVAASPGIAGQAIPFGQILGIAGFVIYLVMLSKRYQLTCGQLVVCFLIQFGMWIGVIILIVLMFGTALFTALA